MNFQQLKYAVAVHEQGHFGQAAFACDVSQATLSTMLKRLEEELGYTLFDRSRKPILTTDKGEQFVALARQTLQLKNSMLALQEEGETLQGKLNLGIIPTIASTLLPLVLPQLMQQFPALKLNVVEITTEAMRQQLIKGSLDLGILATPLQDELLDEQVLYYEPMLVYGVEDEAKNYVTAHDLAKQRPWLLEEGHCFRRQTISICGLQEKRKETEQLHFEGGNFDTLIRLSEQFGGFTLLPELYQQQLSPTKRKKTKSFKAPIPVREVSLVSYRPALHKQRIEQLSSVIRQTVNKHLSTAKYKNSELEIVGI